MSTTPEPDLVACTLCDKAWRYRETDPRKKECGVYPGCGVPVYYASTVAAMRLTDLVRLATRQQAKS